jgi:hypothetical protein
MTLWKMVKDDAPSKYPVHHLIPQEEKSFNAGCICPVILLITYY